MNLTVQKIKYRSMVSIYGYISFLGDRVLVLLPSAPEWYACVLGMMKLGVVVSDICFSVRYVLCSSAFDFFSLSGLPCDAHVDSVWDLLSSAAARRVCHYHRTMALLLLFEHCWTFLLLSSPIRAYPTPSVLRWQRKALSACWRSRCSSAQSHGP